MTGLRTVTVRACCVAIVILAGTALAACRSAPPRRPAQATYDFGLPVESAAGAALAVPLDLDRVSAASWYETPSIHYRLAYAEGARLQSYTQSRWVAPPAELLGLRLRQALAQALGALPPREGGRAEYRLHVELEEFSQVFDSPASSAAVVRATASLVHASDRALLAQRTFVVRQPAASSDAAGAVSALTRASNRLVDELIGWSAATMNQLRSAPPIR